MDEWVRICVQGMDELDKCHSNQQSSVQSELKKEMALLQKRILMDMVGHLLCSSSPLHHSFASASLRLLLPLGIATIIILSILLLLCCVGVFLHCRPLGLFFSKDGRRSLTCATVWVRVVRIRTRSTGELAQMLTRKNYTVPHPALTRSRPVAPGFAVQHDSKPVTNSS